MSTYSPPRRHAATTVLLLTLVGAASLGLLAGAAQNAGDVKGEVAEKPRVPPLTEATATIEDFAFLEGTWRMSRANTEMEEQWSAPLGDGLVGTFRWLRNGRVWMYELMSITKDKGRIMFRLKHFSRQFAGWEEKDEALAYGLTKIEPNKAVFRNPNRDEPRRFVFYRPVPQTLIVRLEGFENGEETVKEFQFSRVKP